MAAPITQKQIAAGLRELGVQPGDSLMVHSSLSSFGRVEGGALAVCRALQDAVTDEGTLLMPSFNHGGIFRKGGEPDFDACFEPRHTPTTNGAIPQAFWQMDDVFRSLNPTHSIAAWGRNAQRFVSGHHRVLTMGTGSPLELLEQEGGYGLLVGVDYGPNTFKHVVEQTNNVPCLAPRTDQHNIRLPDGRVVKGRTWGWRRDNCPYRSASVVAQQEMNRRGLAATGFIGASQVRRFKLADFRTVFEEILFSGLDGAPPCRDCEVPPAVSPFRVASDWDEERGCLKPDSESLTF